MLTRPPGGPTQDVGRHRQLIPEKLGTCECRPGTRRVALLCGPKWLKSLARKRQCFGTLNLGISGREEVGFAGHSPLRVDPSHSDTHNSEIRPSGGVFSRQPWTHRTRCEMGPGSIRQDRGAGTSGDCAGLIFPFLLPARSGLKPESRRSSSTAEAVRFPRPKGPTTMNRREGFLAGSEQIPVKIGLVPRITPARK